MKLQLMRLIMSVDWNDVLMQMGAAQAKAQIWEIVYHLFIFWEITYCIFFFLVGIAGWFKDFERGLGIIAVGFGVMLIVIMFAGGRMLYWYEWKPNFYIG